MISIITLQSVLQMSARILTNFGLHLNVLKASFFLAFPNWQSFFYDEALDMCFSKPISCASNKQPRVQDNFYFRK